jgi:nickel-dependent lactate racemase
MLRSQSSTVEKVSEADVEHLLSQACGEMDLDGKRVLVIIPDGTRTCPLPLIFRLLWAYAGQRVRRLDYLIALGTHRPMSASAISQLLGVQVAEDGSASGYPGVQIFNHRWSEPGALYTAGVISRSEAADLTGGLLATEIPVRINRMILDYDQLIICGPVFPHEVAGFSGGAKYLCPGIAGAEIINFTHWLGALVTNMQTIGQRQTPIRRVIQRAAAYIDVPLVCLALVLKDHDLHGIFWGPQEQAWSQAADLSAHLHIVHTGQPVHSVLAMPALMYDDLWTAAKAMYKTEPAVADGGEVIIYAPHLSELSYTHGSLLKQIGYHVRDYFTAQWERFKDLPGGVLAHSTHVKGAGTYDAASGTERPRIQVTLATALAAEDCHRVNLGYRDYRSIDPRAWQGRIAEGYLYVPNAGEMLYQI